MKKNAWSASLLIVSSLLFSLQPAQADWNMAKSLRELLAGRKEAEAADKDKKQEQEQKNTAPPPEQEQEKEQAPTQTRFLDNKDGTLTDAATGLIWLKDANCAVFFKNDKAVKNSRPWHEARVAAYNLSDGFCGLSDKSQSGDWRLPAREELLKIAKHPQDKDGWPAKQAFHSIQTFYYWSSTLGDLYPDFAFYVSLAYGMDSYAFQLNSFHVLPVRNKKTQP